MKIIGIYNPEQIHQELDGDVKISINRENFAIVKNLNLNEDLIIRHKGSAGEIILKNSIISDYVNIQKDF